MPLLAAAVHACCCGGFLDGGGGVLALRGGGLAVVEVNRRVGERHGGPPLAATATAVAAGVGFMFCCL